MNPTDLTDLLERAPSVSVARARLRPHRGTPGFAQAYFDRIVSHLGSNPEAGRALADRWRLVAELGDDPALAYRAKGASERLRGRWRQSVESFRRAAAETSDPVQKLAYQVGSVDSLARLGQIEEAVQLGRKLVTGLKRLGQSGLAGRCRLNVAAAYLWADHYSHAAKWLEAARKELDEAGLEADGAGARMSLSTCQLHMGHPERARDLALEARDTYERLGMEHMARLCDSNVAQAHLQTGRADEALNILLRLREGYASSAIDSARVEEYLGDAYLRLNMPAEARSAYQFAARHPAMRALPINQANCHLGESLSARALGLARPAQAAAKLAVVGYERFGNPTWAAIGRLAEARTWLDRDRPARAATTVEDAVSTLRQSRAEFALAEAYLILAEVRFRQGQSPDTALKEAERRVRRRGMAGLEWRVYDLRAQSSARGRLKNYRKMAQSIARMRATVVSTYAKTNYLADKSEALGRYLDALLSRPTLKRIDEAIEVIRTTRAAALVDEAISAMPPALAASRAIELAALRDELTLDESGESGGGGTRRLRGGGVGRAVLARRWIELTHTLTSPQTVPEVARRDDVCILASTSTRCYLLRHGAAECLASPSEFGRALRWLRYALFEPLADRLAPADAVMGQLQRFRDEFARVWRTGERFVPIAPDSEFWGVPWAALGNLREPIQEPVLCLSPGFGRGAESVLLGPKPRVVVWGAPRADLPQIEEEIQTICRQFPNALWLRSAAQVREFLDGGEADLIHVAGHARLDPDKPMFSYLELENGRIHAMEIARSAMRTRLAVLSACDTGSLSVLNRFEPEGLVRGFLARGAEAALASMWALDDEVAAQFAQTFYESLSGGQIVGIAVSEARVKIKKDFAHPYFWAPMTLFGGYTP